jgi:uncharacterized membrane protein
LKNPYEILIFRLATLLVTRNDCFMRTLEVAMIGVCAALYAVIGRLTDLGITVGGVAFWPAAVIPAVFAFLFGPWSGGIGAAIGIFIRDMLFHGDPLLSLSAGVSANFVAFFVIGYFSRSNLGWRKMVLGALIGGVIIGTGLLLPTVLLPGESEAFTQLSSSDSIILFTGAVIVSVLFMMVMVKFWPNWRKYGIGSIVGLGLGSAIVALAVWAYSQMFFSPQGYFTAPISSSFILVIFVWTFATEIPFVLVLGPPIIKACCRAIPSLRAREASQKKGR